jgi:hypothetical protein
MGARAVVKVNCLSDRGHFTSAPVFHDFEGETIGELDAGDYLPLNVGVFSLPPQPGRVFHAAFGTV